MEDAQKIALGRKPKPKAAPEPTQAPETQGTSVLQDVPQDIVHTVPAPVSTRSGRVSRPPARLNL